MLSELDHCVLSLLALSTRRPDCRRGAAMKAGYLLILPGSRTGLNFQEEIACIVRTTAPVKPSTKSFRTRVLTSIWREEGLIQVGSRQ